MGIEGDSPQRPQSTQRGEERKGREGKRREGEEFNTRALRHKGKIKKE